MVGRTACHIGEAEAMRYIAGYTVVNDISVPHASYYRPSMRFKCCDGFCPIGPAIVPRAMVANPDALNISVSLDGVVVHRSNTSELVRPIRRLLADVTEFMTLYSGDILSVGVAAGSPRARAGQRVTITIDGVGQLENTLVAQEMR